MIQILEETTKFPLQKIGQMAGICWNSPVDDKEKNIKRAKDCIISGHHRVLEYVDVELCISKISARMIREWYTHIGGSPTRLQESTRYVNCEKFEYVVPPKIQNSEEAEVVYDEIMKSIQSSYKKLSKLNVPREDAAMILPLAMYTKIVDKRNLRNLIEMSHQRLCSRAYWEYREVMNEIKQKLSDYSDEWKWICDKFFVPKCDVSGFCTEKKSCGRRPKKEIEL